MYAMCPSSDCRQQKGTRFVQRSQVYQARNNSHKWRGLPSRESEAPMCEVSAVPPRSSSQPPRRNRPTRAPLASATLGSRRRQRKLVVAVWWAASILRFINRVFKCVDVIHAFVKDDGLLDQYGEANDHSGNDASNGATGLDEARGVSWSDTDWSSWFDVGWFDGFSGF